MSRADVIGVVSILSATMACGPRTVPALQPAPVILGPTKTVVVVLPNAETGQAGRAVVKGDTAAIIELDEAFESTVVRRNAAPEPARVLTKAEFDFAFAEALAAVPPTPRHFTLHFQFESDELTDADRALLPDVLASVRDYPAPAVTVIGHTDAAGSRTSNFDLGRQRAEVVKALLTQIGLNAASIEVVSHGETDPLVPTADGVFEPLNRRVDVVVR